MFLFYLLRGWK